MNKKWQVYNVNEAQVEEIINNNNVNKLIATILSIAYGGTPAPTLA